MAETSLLGHSITQDLRRIRDRAVKDLPTGWFEGPWGECTMCGLGILEGEVGFRSPKGIVMHSRCLTGEAHNAPPDRVDSVKDEIKELLNG